MAAPSFSVFVTVGTSLDPFDRLLRMVDALRARGELAGPLLAQSGHCRYAPRHFPTVPFLPSDELEAQVRAAGVVICHGGAGSIGTCLLLRKRPVVVPRRAAQGEIVNDHQLELCRRLAKEGRVYLAEDEAEIISAVEAARAAGPAPPPQGATRLKAALSRILDQLAQAPRKGR